MEIKNKNQLVVSLNGVQVPVDFVWHHGRLLCVALPSDCRNDEDCLDTAAILEFFEGRK